MLGPSSIDQASYVNQSVRLDRKNLQILKYVTHCAYKHKGRFRGYTNVQVRELTATAENQRLLPVTDNFSENGKKIGSLFAFTRRCL
jgi:hypothetical protein